MDEFWPTIRRHLGLDALARKVSHLHEHFERQERTMAKLSDELADISRRQDAIRDAITASGTNLRTAIDKLAEQVDELRNGDLDDEAQAKVDAIKATADDIRSAAEGMDDGFEPPVVEPSPFPASDSGAAGDGERTAL